MTASATQSREAVHAEDMPQSTAPVPLPATRDTLAAAGAIGAVVAFIVALLLLPADSGGQSPADIAARYSDGSAAYLRAAVAEGMSVAFFMVFVAGLRHRLAHADEQTQALASAAVISATVAATLQLAAYALIATLAYRTAADAGAAVVTALYDLSSIAGQFSCFGLAVFFFAAGIAMIRTGAVSRALGYAGLLLAALSLVTAGSLARAGAFSIHEGPGFLTLMLFYLWLLAAGVIMTRRRLMHAPAPEGE
jgi:hypothetical protein